MGRPPGARSYGPIPKNHVGSFLVPCLKSDLVRFGALLDCWADYRLYPTNRLELRSRVLVILLNNASAEELDTFRKVALSYDVVNSIFSEVRAESANLTGDMDLYIKGSEKVGGKWGNKAGPNNLFFSGIEKCAGSSGFMFQCEVDCYPLERGWLDQLDDACSLHPSAWVIGSAYCGEYPISDSIQFHINGNALYNVSDPAFTDFVQNVWQARMLDFVELDPNLAYDCWWSFECSRASGQDRNRSWRLVLSHSHRMVAIPMVLNLLHRETLMSDIEISKEIAISSGSRFSMLHSGFLNGIILDFLASEDEYLLGYLARPELNITPSIGYESSKYIHKVLLTGNRDAIGEGKWLGLSKMGQSTFDGYKDITLQLSIGENSDDMSFLAKIRLQLFQGKTYLEFRPQDNRNIVVPPAFEVHVDEWGPVIKFSSDWMVGDLHKNLNAAFAAKTGLRTDYTMFDNLLLLVIEHWSIFRNFAIQNGGNDFELLPEGDLTA